MPAELHGLDPDEVSLVGKAANRRTFLIRKGADMALDEVKALELVDKLDKAGLGDVLELLAAPDSVELQKAKKAKPEEMDDETWGKLTSAMKIMGPGLAKRFKMNPVGDGDQEEAHDEEGPASFSEDNRDEEPPTKRKQKKKGKKPMGDSEDQELAKADIENVELRERLEKAEGALTAIREREERRSFIAKAAEFSAIPGATADDLGSVLHKASKTWEPKEYAMLLRIFKAAHETIKTGQVFKEVGSDGEGGSQGAYDLIRAEAAKLMEKSATPMTPEQARAKVIRARPDLLRQANEEQDERIRKGGRK